MKEKSIAVFNADVDANEGYLYTNTQKLSCKLSNQRVSDAIRQMSGNLTNKTIIDIGCGDGTYTRELLSYGPSFIKGIDASSQAIEIANRNTAQFGNIQFETVDIYDLSETKIYDIAIVRGILHHLYHVEKAINIICKIAKVIVVVEPNGFNPVLKVIEKVSPYHIQHEEKSYSPKKLDRWFKNNGGNIADSTYIGLVPIFSPDWLAKTCKFFEPFFEKMPLLRQIACAQYVQKIVIPE